MTTGNAKPAWRKGLEVLGGALIALILTVMVVVVWLVTPGTPSRSSVLDFKGYIELPGPRALNVLDYMTLNGKQLFVTGESTGKVYRIDLAAGNTVIP